MTDADPSKIPALKHSFKAFNTVNSILAYTSDASVADKIDALQKRYELLFSRTNPASELSRINSSAGKAVEVDAELAAFIATSLDYCEQSDGLYDITMGSVVRLWDFKAGIIPSKLDIEESLKHVDWRCVHVEGNSVLLDDSKSTIDLGGIAKGYIADKLLELMQDHGITSAMVNLGGNVAVLGDKPDGSAWKVGIRMPTSSKLQFADKAFASLEIRNGSVVTSGIYERAFVHAGQLYHHILDPKTGYPVKSDLLGATLVSSKSLDGDGYTTALIIMGLDKALQFVEARVDLEAIFVDDQGKVYATSDIGKAIPFKIFDSR